MFLFEQSMFIHSAFRLFAFGMVFVTDKISNFVVNIIDMRNYITYFQQPNGPIQKRESHKIEGEIDIDEYLKQRIADAVNNARTRTMSYPKPKWWDDDKNGYWLDCIATALSNYHKWDIPTGNFTFKERASDLGFEEYTDSSQLQIGDIVQYRQPDGTPYHSLMFIGKDENGVNKYAYSNGSGFYHQNAYYNGEAMGYTPHYYRYIGTPAERRQIEDHNVAVRAKNKEIYGNEEGNMQLLKPEKQFLDVKPIQAEDFLRNIKLK